MFDNISAQSTFYVGQKIEARDPSFPQYRFCNATITEVKHNEIKVKYDKWVDDTYDQWIQKDDYDYIKRKTKSKPPVKKKNKKKKTIKINDAKMFDNISAQSAFYVGQKNTSQGSIYSNSYILQRNHYRS
eukprot:24485_1